MSYNLVSYTNKEIEGVDDYDEIIDEKQTNFKINSNTKMCIKTHDCTLKISNMKNDMFVSSTGRKTNIIEIMNQNGGIVVVDLYRDVYLKECKNAVFNITTEDDLNLYIQKCENIKINFKSNTDIDLVIQSSKIISFESKDVDPQLNDDMQKFKNEYLDL